MLVHEESSMFKWSKDTHLSNISTQLDGHNQERQTVFSAHQLSIFVALMLSVMTTLHLIRGVTFCDYFGAPPVTNQCLPVRKRREITVRKIIWVQAHTLTSQTAIKTSSKLDMMTSSYLVISWAYGIRHGGYRSILLYNFTGLHVWRKPLPMHMELRLIYRSRHGTNWSYVHLSKARTSSQQPVSYTSSSLTYTMSNIDYGDAKSKLYFGGCVVAHASTWFLYQVIHNLSLGCM